MIFPGVATLTAVDGRKGEIAGYGAASTSCWTDESADNVASNALDRPLMTEQLDQALRRLVKASRADAALVFSRTSPTDDVFVLSGYPAGIPSGSIPSFVPDGVATGAIEHNPARLSERLPESMLRALPTPPTAARTFSLGMLSFGGIILSPFGLPLCRLPAPDQTQAFGILAVTLV